MAGAASAMAALFRRVHSARRWQIRLTRVDVIIVNGDGPVSGELSHQFAGPVFQASVETAGDITWIKGRPLVAFAGIGNPRRFFDLVRTLGGELGAELAFADHQPLSEADAGRILALARQHGAGIITTEKDFARLSAATGALARLKAEAKPLPIRLVLPPADLTKLEALLTAAIDRKRQR